MKPGFESRHFYSKACTSCTTFAAYKDGTLNPESNPTVSFFKRKCFEWLTQSLTLHHSDYAISEETELPHAFFFACIIHSIYMNSKLFAFLKLWYNIHNAKFTILFYFLALPRSLCDLSSPTRD